MIQQKIKNKKKVVNTTTLNINKKEIYLIFKNNYFYFIAIVLLSFIFILLTNTIYIFYDDNFVKKEFKKNNIGNYIEDAFEIDIKIRNYLTFQSPIINSDKLKENEIMHLYDVKILFLVGLILILFLPIIIFVLIIKLYKNIKQKFSIKNNNYLIQIIFIIFQINSLVFLIIFGLFGFIIYNYFDYFFILFHKILFFNDLWLMNYDDILIQLYPQSFFINAFSLIILRTMSIFIILWLIIYTFIFLKKYLLKIKNKP
jgi:integral membrane protein (TIGR01906 family)